MQRTDQWKYVTRKPDIVYIEYGRTVVKKAKSGTIKHTDADMKADASLFLIEVELCRKMSDQ